MEPIKIYIGISKKFDIVKGMTEASIAHNTRLEPDEYEIIHLYPNVEAGCTGFSNVRYNIETGIYLDCDMIVLSDIAELWAYREKNKFVCMRDGSSEVAVIEECYHSCSHKTEEARLPKKCVIPDEWNIEDYKYFNCPNELQEVSVKLFHFTALPSQPWFHGGYPIPWAERLSKQYIEMAERNNVRRDH